MDNGNSAKTSNGATIWVIISLVLLLALAAGCIYVAWVYQDVRETARDIALIVLALFQMISAVLMVALLVALIFAVRAMQRTIIQTVIPKIDATVIKMDEVLDNTRSISGNLRESATTTTTTTVFVAEQVVSPIIRVSSMLTGVRAAVRELARHDAEAHEQSSS